MATQDIFSGEEAAKRLQQLPADIRNLIYSADMTRIIRKIGDAHHLHIDQVGRMESETSFLMLGFTEQKDFVRVLSERIPIDTDTAAKIAIEVHDELLVKIRQSLQKIYPENVDPVTGQRPSPVAIIEKQVTPPSLPSIAARLAAPVITPTLTAESAKSSQTNSLASIDEALHAPQTSVSDTPRAENAPAKTKPTDYSMDPYLEPIE